MNVNKLDLCSSRLLQMFINFFKRCKKRISKQFYLLTQAGVFEAIELMRAWGAVACALRNSYNYPITELTFNNA